MHHCLALLSDSLSPLLLLLLMYVCCPCLWCVAEVSTSKERSFAAVDFVDTPGLVDGDMKVGDMIGGGEWRPELWQLSLHVTPLWPSSLLSADLFLHTTLVVPRPAPCNPQYPFTVKETIMVSNTQQGTRLAPRQHSTAQYGGCPASLCAQHVAQAPDSSPCLSTAVTSLIFLLPFPCCMCHAVSCAVDG